MPRYTNAFRLFFLLCAGILNLSAQTETGEKKPESTGRLAWFACLSKPEGLENPVKVLVGEKLTELELPEFMTSEAVKIPDDGMIRIVRVTPDPADEGKPKYIVLAAANIPVGVHEALVILDRIPQPAGDLLFRSKVQDLAAFKGGDRLYINLSDTNIRVSLGKATVPIRPREARIYESPKLANPENMPVMYEFYHPIRKEWKILTASTVVIRPTRREIFVFNNGTRPGNIKKHGILFPVQNEEP
jgi:hypothetical protein